MLRNLPMVTQGVGQAGIWDTQHDSGVHAQFTVSLKDPPNNGGFVIHFHTKE